jgi:hypothetical protein
VIQELLRSGFPIPGCTFPGVPEGHISSAHVARRRELDALLRGGDEYGVADAGEVTHDALVLGRGHLDFRRVVLVRDAQVLHLNRHQLEVEVRDAVLVRRLEHKRQLVRVVLRFKGDGILVPCSNDIC